MRALINHCKDRIAYWYIVVFKSSTNGYARIMAAEAVILDKSKYGLPKERSLVFLNSWIVK